MIHILGLLLKTIGWIMLGILGVILGILLLVLFSAVRYKAAGKKKGQELEGQIKITWLLWILSVHIVYKDGLEVKIKLFGRTVRKLELGKAAGGQKKAGDALPGSGSVPGAGPATEAGPVPEPGAVTEAGPVPEPGAVTEPGSVPEPGPMTEPGSVPGPGPVTEPASVPETGAVTKPESVPETASGGTGADSREGAGEPGEPGYLDTPGSGPGGKGAGKEPSGDDLGEQKAVAETWDDRSGGNVLQKVQGIFRRLWDRICALCQKLLSSIRFFGDKLEAVQEKIGQAQERWERLQAFLQDPANHRSARLIGRQAKKILRHLSPRKGSAQVTFGLEDPCQMGQVLSVAAFLYPFTHAILTLTPVFDEKILEGEGWIKGHIRIGVLLGHVLRLFSDKNIRQRLWRQIRPSRKRAGAGRDKG